MWMAKISLAGSHCGSEADRSRAAGQQADVRIDLRKHHLWDPVPMKDVWEAAQAAGLADDIEQMPMGMHTVVAEAVRTSLEDRSSGC